MKEIKILHLYPDLLNLYGDRGNISAMQKRLEWRGIKADVTVCNKDDSFNAKDFDIIFLGGGSDREQEVVVEKLIPKKQELLEYIEDDGVLVAFCGGFPMLGKYYPSGDGRTDGLGLLDIYTEEAKGRFIGNVMVESELVSQKIIGFENHPGKTVIGSYKPLGKVICGYGNTGDGGYEGLVYKNVFASYLHGPVFPKNQELCDYVLAAAMKKKYDDFEGFEPLNDELENMANKFMEKKLSGDK